MKKETISVIKAVVVATATVAASAEKIVEAISTIAETVGNVQVK